jgi:hypothetical protein
VERRDNMRIKGYFGKIKNAKSAVEKLKGIGIKEAFVDVNDHYAEHRNLHIRLSGTETSVSLTGLVLELTATKIDRDKSPLTASSPMVSGYGNFEEVADVNCKIVVEATEN